MLEDRRARVGRHLARFGRRESYGAGAVMGNDISGFSDPDYLPAAREAGATVVATHIRLAPRVEDPDPHYDDLVTEVRSFPPTEPAGREMRE